MKKGKKIIALALCILMCLPLLVACGGGTTDTPSQTPGSQAPGSQTPESAAPTTPGIDAPPPEDDDVKYAENFDSIMSNQAISVINPFSPASSVPPVNWVFTMIYDRLIERIHSTGELLPSLATSWETEDLQHFTFQLRDDVLYHNGDKFTAKDVEATILLSRDGPGSQANDTWRNVEEINIIGDYTIELVLSGPDADFIEIISRPPASIVNSKAIAADPEKGTWIGTGPYIVTDFATNDFINYKRNDAYWGKAPISATQTWRFIPEVSTRTIIMQNKEADISGGISADDVKLFQADPENYNIISNTLNTPIAIQFNMDDPVAGDKNFRMAVAHALERDEIAIFAAGDWAQPATDGGYWGFQTPFYNYDIPLIPYDLDKAKEYLAASPYNGEELEILCPQQPAFARGAEVISQQLAKIGLNTTLNLMDPASLLSITTWAENKSRILIYSSQFTLTVSSARNILYPGASENRSMYSNPEITELLDKARVTVDENERKDIYMKIQDIFAEDMPMINTYWRLLPFVAVKGVGGVGIYPEHGLDDYRYAYKIIED